MGGEFSSIQHLYVHQFENPRLQECKKTILVRLVARPGAPYFVLGHDNPLQSLVSKIDTEQTAVLLEIRYLYAHNECAHPLRVVFSGLFAANNDNVDAPHIDDTGELVVPCPPSFSGAIELNDRILYRPGLPPSTITSYAGLSSVIMQDDRDMCVPLDDKSNRILLSMDHPIVHYIIANTNTLKPAAGDAVKHTSKGYFEVSPEMLQRARDSFMTAVHARMRQTRFEDSHISCEVPDALRAQLAGEKDPAKFPNVVVQLEISYLLITRGELKMKHGEIKI